MNVLWHYLCLSSLLFITAFVGIIINRRNIITLFMCIELMLLSASMNFVVTARYFGNVQGEILVFFVLAVAASESAIALAILILMYRQKNTVNMQYLNKMVG